MTVELLLGQQEYPTPKSETNHSPPCVVVDSGASSSVVGLPWLKSRFECAGFTSFQTCIDGKLKSGDKKFKFGNQLTFDSMGTLDVIGQVQLYDAKRSKQKGL